ncbi:MAG: glycosyltransferase [Bdellovibrionota bacterium]|nr:glycosyltransferase [Bdellovibrionota bacterium]
MKIVFQHLGVLPVVKYGGIERILFWHMKELASRGHNVVLIGNKDSDVERYGIELIESPLEMEEIEEVIPKDADLLHLTFNYELKKREIPVLYNIQGNGQIGEKFSRNTVFVSRRHAENHGAESFIYNAIDFEEYPYKDRPYKLDELMFLAKGSWSVKNLKHCVWAAKKSKKKLHIAGGRTFLPSRYVVSHGMVGGDEKLEILKKTDALLFPVRWHEPFGIAIIEAMAMGSPVFGSPYGSLPELINEDTGFICHNKFELLEKILINKDFKRSSIRAYTQEKFSISRLTDDYINAYERIINGESLNREIPSWQLEKPPLELLDF